MENNIRLRFAPSPTGFLHIGSLRTVLFSYIIAKKLKGKLLLRIEDTDQKREVQGAVESLISILDWSGIEFDEGPHIGGNFGPYIQTERLDIYNKHIETLLKNKKAYKCFCTSERLQTMREEQQAKKLPPRYDRCCRNLSDEEIAQKEKNGETFVIRQTMPLDGDIVVYDEIRGEIKFQNSELDDHVLIKSNGIPTYQFASVVDDHLMEISHVTRAEEWIPSFPKNILLYQAFGWTPPKFIHYPFIANQSGGKLSKRQGDVAVEDFRYKGYLAKALINFCGLLGWHPKDDNEILELDEIIEKFELKDMSAKPAIFDIDKLDYFNGYYIRQLSIDDLTRLCEPYLRENIELSGEQRKKNIEFIKKIVSVEQERLKKLSEIGDLSRFFFIEDLEYEKEILAWKKMTTEEAQENLKTIYELLEKIPEENWTNDSIEEGIMSYLQAKELRIGEYLWPMRVSLCGQKNSPGPFDIAEILGKSETIRKIEKAINL